MKLNLCTSITILSLLTQAVLAQNKTTATNDGNNHVVPGGILKSCIATRTRKDIRDLSQGDRKKFFDAIKKMAQDGSYDKLVNKHSGSNGGFFALSHSTPMFLPLHRCYLREFEDKLRDIIGDDFALPYWDWSLDSQAPAQSVIFTDDYFGANDPANGFHVADGPFKASEFTVNGKPLVRQYHKANMSTFHHPSLLAPIMKGGKSFSEMSQDLEIYPHGLVHTTIGGDEGTISTDLSPSDPIFWMHHAFIDKLWTDWQDQGDNERKFDGVAYEQPNVNENTMIAPYGLPVSAILKNKNICVRYEDPKTKGTDPEKIKSVKAPGGIPDAWLNKTGTNRTSVEKAINKTKEVTSQVNKNITEGLPVDRPHTSNNSDANMNSSAQGVYRFMNGLNVALAIAFYFSL